MDIQYGGTLVKGDMMAISSGNCVYISWYLGRGPSGTVQYYDLNQLSHYYDLYENSDTERGKLKYSKPRVVYYVNSPTKWRFVKITEAAITDPEDIIRYQKAINVLTRLKIIN